MKASDLKIILAASIRDREPVLITGAPGVGKSDVVVQAAAEAGADLVIMHPVVSDPTDFKGLPGIVNDKAEFLPFGELRKIMEATTPTVCFGDDIGQAPMSVQAAWMQLLLAREINGKKISDHVTFIGATNRREDKAGVTGLLEPVKSRFTGGIYQLDVDVDDWIEWALNAGLPIDIIAFVKFRPGMLHDFKATSDLVNSPSPRTVAAVGRALNRGLPPHLELDCFTGIAGSGLATELLAFLKIRRQLPNIDSIMINPQGFTAPSNPSVLYAIAGAIARKANENTMDRVTVIADKLPQEFAVLLMTMAERFTTVVRSDGSKWSPITDTRAYIAWHSRHAKDLI